MSKIKIVIVGSSHAFRLGKALEKIIDHSKFGLINLARPGQQIKFFEPPEILNDLTIHDHLVVWMGGNDLMKNRPKKIFVKGKKFFQIKHCEPAHEYDNRLSFEKLANRVQGCSAHNLVFDMPYRHLSSEDPLPEVIEWLFKTRNHLFKECLEEKSLILRKYISYLNVGRTNRLRSRYAYRKLLIDDIHFKPEIYANVAGSVVKRMLRISNVTDNVYVNPSDGTK
jgi:hypothetical protein